MRHLLTILIFLSASLPSYSWDRRFSDHVNAIHDGADAAVVLQVVDSEGVPVANADVWASFVCNTRRKSSVQTLLSDTNGLVRLKGRTSGQINLRVSKGGYYRTDTRHDFGQATPPIVDGKWQPWSASREVVLKKIVWPTSMLALRAEFVFPTNNTPSIGLDLFLGDWVHPYGKGEQADLLIQLEEKVSDIYTWHKKMTITFGQGGLDGVVINPKDNYSQLMSPYRAPSNGYIRTFSWEYNRTKENILMDTGLSEDRCFIYRIRTQTNGSGEITSAYYGKIYGPVGYGRIGGEKTWLKIMYYLNPKPNDPNLEFDSTKNLLADPKLNRIYMP